MTLFGVNLFQDKTEDSQIRDLREIRLLSLSPLYHSEGIPKGCRRDKYRKMVLIARVLQRYWNKRADDVPMMSHGCPIVVARKARYEPVMISVSYEL